MKMSRNLVHQMEIKGKTVYLKYPQQSDCDEFTTQAKSSCEFHANLVTPPTDSEDFLRYIGRNELNNYEGFFIRKNETKEIVGAVNLSQIFRGGFQNAYLGYYLFENFGGKGLMTEALNLAIKFAFDGLKLHRLEANIQPHNLPSINLIKRCGFTHEGFSRRYLMIDGKWCDHERWAIIVEDWEQNLSNSDK